VCLILSFCTLAEARIFGRRHRAEQQYVPQAPAAVPVVDQKAPIVSDKPASVEPAIDNMAEVEKQLLEATNAQRARYGLRALIPHSGILQNCRNHCNWMARMRSMTHQSGPYAENIAMGQSTVHDVVNTWMNSSGHRANILGGYTYAAMTMYTDANGTAFWCQQFSN